MRGFFLHLMPLTLFFRFFFFNDTATTEIYTLSLHDALPIYLPIQFFCIRVTRSGHPPSSCFKSSNNRSEEHTSELQSRLHLVCRLLLEKKKNNLRVITYLHCCITHIFCSAQQRATICRQPTV